MTPHHLTERTTRRPTKTSRVERGADRVKKTLGPWTGPGPAPILLPMSSSDATAATGEKRVPPAPVIVVIVYVGLWAVSFVVLGIGLAVAGGEPAVALLALGGLVPGAAALGLWQGNRGARVVAILLFGVVLGLLLLAVPRSSRAWFAPDLYPDDLDDLDDLDDEAPGLTDKA